MITFDKVTKKFPLGNLALNNVSFDIEDKDKFEEIARKEAVNQAKEKAEAAAKAAGFKLGKIIGYSETSEGAPSPIAFDRASFSPMLNP